MPRHDPAAASASTLATLALALLGALACLMPEEDTACARDVDCFRGQVCAQGRCLEGQPAADMDDPVTSRPDASPPLEEPGPCQPRSSRCEDDQDPGLRLDRAQDLEGSAWGCPAGGALEARSVTLEGRLCALDDGDAFSLIVQPCPEGAHELVAILQTSPTCQPERLRLGLRWNGQLLGCDHERTSCSRAPNGARQIALRVDPEAGGSTKSVAVEVAPAQGEGLELDYVLTLRQREITP